MFELNMLQKKVLTLGNNGLIQVFNKGGRKHNSIVSLGIRGGILALF